MANKRDLKKEIKYVCGDIAVDALMIRDYVKDADTQKLEELVIRLADLQQNTLRNISFAFDRSHTSFDNEKAYRKAAHQYFHQAYAKLREEFNKQIFAAVKTLNEAVPAAQKELNKTIAAK